MTKRNQSEFAGYDIIGDVHGCAYTLEKLLQKMDYQKLDGIWQHKNRQAVFLGDVVDRGPHIREALHMVKDMCDLGKAKCIMGNHEFNALAYTTLAPKDSEQRFVRAHTPRHNRLISETLEQFAPYPEEWRCFLDWFKRLPLFLDMPGFRVVHACWDDNLIKQFKSYFAAPLDDEFIMRTMDRSSLAHKIIDRLTRGTDIPMPSGKSITSKDGFTRKSFRTKFWSDNPKTYLDVVFQPDPLPEDIAQLPLTGDEKCRLLQYDHRQPPVFVGHYWLQGKPKPMRPNVACLDYSAVKYGRLVAYRYDGETELSANKFQWVYVDPDD